MTPTQALNLLDAAEDKRIAAGEGLREAKETVVAACAPYKVGDVLEVNGHSYRGKPMKVMRVSLRSRTVRGGRAWFWFAVGPVLKKNGEPGMQRGERNDPLLGGTES